MMPDALDRARSALSQSETLLATARQRIIKLKKDIAEAEQRGREGGIRDAIKVQDPYKAGLVEAVELIRKLRSDIPASGPFLAPDDVRQWLETLARQVKRRAALDAAPKATDVGQVEDDPEHDYAPEVKE